MEATKRNLQAWTGSLYELAVTWTEDGTPKDLSDWTAALVVTTRSATPETLLTQAATTDDQGNVVALIDPDDLPEKGSYAWRLELVQDTDPPRYLMVGRFDVGDARDV